MCLFLAGLRARPESTFLLDGACHASRLPDIQVTPEQVTLDQSLSTPETRTKAVATVMAQLRDSGVITGWRDELFPVSESFSAEPLLLVERAAASMFGIKAYGVHINGYVKRADGSMAMWVARRSKTKQTWPGMLDHIVAGTLGRCTSNRHPIIVINIL